MALADCHLVIQKMGAADAVLPLKLTNILAVGGQALITAEEDTELGKLCHESLGIAVRVEPESLAKIEVGIREVLAKEGRNKIGQS